MKLKSIIFFTILAIGTLPLLVLVSINLQNHINRHEESLQENIGKRSKLSSQAFSEKISKVATDLDRIAALRESQELFSQLNSETPVAPIALLNMEMVINQWYGENIEIEGLFFCTVNGTGKTTLERNPEESRQFISTTKTPEYLPVPSQKLSASGIFMHQESSHESNETKIIFYYSVLENGDAIGTIFLQAKISLLAAEDHVLWLNPAGNTTTPLSFQTTAPANQSSLTDISAYEYADALKHKFSDNRPFIWKTPEEHTISWLPIMSDNSPAPLIWAGIIIDKGTAQKWRRSLIINISIVLMATMFVIFCIANFIAFRIDHIKKNILQGLDKILKNDENVRFQWPGPQEITVLADELNILAQHYFQTRSASRLAEQQLRESENKFRKLTSSAQDAIIMMDNSGNIAYWNKSAERMFGYNEDQAMGQPVHELLSLTRIEQQTLSDSKDFSHTNAAAPSDILELFAKRIDGSDIPIELSLSATQIKKQWHAIWIVRDISERKQSEKEAELRRQQLVQADKMRSLGLLVSGVAHEINNPNSIAMLNAPMLTKAWQDVSPILEQYYRENGEFIVAGLDYSEMRLQIPQLFSELIDSGKRIKNIVKDLKDYARKDKPTAAELLDINKIIETAIRLTHNLVKKSTSAFHVELCPQCPQFYGNKQRLEQVIINLIQNSCEALTDSQQAIRVTSSFEKNSATIIISVDDEGVGMPKETITQLTDPFFTTKRNSGGTGLGLSVSAGIIKEHGGTLVFTSSPETGTTAEVRLPT
nr:PAS domain S-box protein [Desulfobulbaceae bacterium]